ncbi:hypothetical protein CSE45_3476 [Citreicella sp. SE45]|nr:hypothetical protein CSE45_3476 [Citreicella sp. SE45]
MFLRHSVPAPKASCHVLDSSSRGALRVAPHEARRLTILGCPMPWKHGLG